MASILSKSLKDLSRNIIGPAGVTSGGILSSLSRIHITDEPQVGDVLFYLDLPSNCILHSLIFRNTKMESGQIIVGISGIGVNIGIYASSKFKLEDGTIFSENEVINESFFGSNATMFNTNLEVSGIDQRYSRDGMGENGNNSNTGIDSMQDALWELAGLSTDPLSTLRIGGLINVGFVEFSSGVTICQALFSGKN